MTATVPSAPLVLRLHPGDGVIIARVDLAPGAVVPGEVTTVRETVPRGHKLATRGREG